MGHLYARIPTAAPQATPRPQINHNDISREATRSWSSRDPDRAAKPGRGMDACGTRGRGGVIGAAQDRDRFAASRLAYIPPRVRGTRARSVHEHGNDSPVVR